MKKLLLVLFSSILALVLVGCGEKENETKTEVKAEKKVLKVGMELAYPPFEMSEKDGTPSGVSVDLQKH